MNACGSPRSTRIVSRRISSAFIGGRRTPPPFHPRPREGTASSSHHHRGTGCSTGLRQQLDAFFMEVYHPLAVESTEERGRGQEEAPGRRVEQQEEDGRERVWVSAQHPHLSRRISSAFIGGRRTLPPFHPRPREGTASSSRRHHGTGCPAGLRQGLLGEEHRQVAVAVMVALVGVTKAID
jgi:hypothetical protein